MLRPRALLACLAVVAAACTHPADAQVVPRSGSARGIDTIKHVIVVVQENRSFDSYFGTFPGAAGIPKKADGSWAVCLPWPKHKHCAKPYHDPDLYDAGGPHNLTASKRDVNGGKMNGFLQLTKSYCTNHPRFGPCAKAKLGPAGQPDVMGYHDAREIPNYWAYANKFLLQDHMFAPSDSWTLPSHLFLVSAWAARCSDLTDPMSCTSDLQQENNKWTDKNHPYAWTDITYLLHKHDVSWAYYVGNDTCIAEPCPKPTGDFTVPAQNPLPGFRTVAQDKQLSNVKGHDAYFSAAAAGTLPSVSWVMPGIGYSEHPPYSIAKGQAWVTKVVNAAMQGPDWNSTAIFVTWDDWGGFYDNVKPIRVDQNGYGIRVPGLMISPWACGGGNGTIDHQTLSFDAYLKFIEDRFLGSERISRFDGRPDSRPTVREKVPALGDLSKEFCFGQTPIPPLMLDPTPAG